MATNEQALNKLQKEKEDFNSKDRNLEQVEAEMIEKYKMKEGNYKILITVYEANDLQPRGTNFLLFHTEKTACDAFVEIEVRDQKKKTKIRPQTNNPIFDEHFYFHFDNMSVEDLDTSKIVFTIYDKKNFILSDSLIGNFEVDWTNVYFRRNHEIYRGWLTFSDPTDQFQGPVGYLLVDIAVLGPNDQITIHDSAFIKDPLTTIQDTITSAKLLLIDFAINIDIYRAENLAPIDLFTRDLDAYVVAKFSGNKIQSTVISGLNPEWNEMLRIGASVPCKSKYLSLQVWNRNRIRGDDLVGVIKVPFSQICDIENPQPRWGHLYGPPISGKDKAPGNHATKMQIYGQQLGSHYRGRLFYKVTGKKYMQTKNVKTDITFQFPYRPTPVVALKSYTLRIDLLDGFNLPNKKLVCVHVSIGQYLIKSKREMTTLNGLCEFFQTLDDKKVQFPQDVTQIPDLILYFCQGSQQKDRMSFIRIKASEIISANKANPSKIYELRGDKSLDLLSSSQIGGYISARITLFSEIPPPPKKIQSQYQKKISYSLKIMLFKGEQLPSVNDTGDCDPKIKFNCYGFQKMSKTIQNTYNPIWNQIITMQVEMQDIFSNNFEKGIVCQVYDDQNLKQDNYIGNFMFTLSEVNKTKFRIKGKNSEPVEPVYFLYRKPQWYNIINPNIQIGDNTCGKILMAVALFRSQDTHCLPAEVWNRTAINIKTEIRTVQMFLIGLRELKPLKKGKYLDNQKLKVEVRMADSEPIVINKLVSKNGGCQIHQLQERSVAIPKNKNLIPFIDIKAFYEGVFESGDTFIGSNSVNIYKVLPKLKQLESEEKDVKKQKKNDDENSEDTLLDVELLEQQLQQIEQKKEKEKLKSILNVYYSKKVEELVPPAQLGSKPLKTATEQVEFNEIIQEFHQNFETHEDFDYVRKLKQQYEKDKLQIHQTFKRKTIQQVQSENIQDDQQQKFIEKGQINQSEANDNSSQKFAKQKPPTLLIPRNSTMHRSGKAIETSSMAKRVVEVNSRAEVQKSYKDTNNRYKVVTDPIDKNQDGISNFQVKTQDVFTEKPIKERAINYQQIERAMNQEIKDEKEARQREEEYKYANAVKLTLFGWRREKAVRNMQTYEDYDTDQGQNLDIIPDWYKGRKILASDFEDITYKSKKVHSVPIFIGRKDENSHVQMRIKEQIGSLKMIMLSQPTEAAQEKADYYKRLLKPRSFLCRIYILKGKSLISNYDSKPSTFLKISFGDKEFNLKDRTYSKEQHNPEYYVCQQIPMQIPGPSQIKIQVMEAHNIVGKLYDRTLGYTQIDLEERYFMKKWHLYDKKPIQLRNLYSEYGIGTQGRLQTWIDLVDKKKWLMSPAHKIHPPPFDKYQLRVIVWQTEDCVFKNQAMESNDIFVRGSIGTSEPQETDTHWACRATGNFNYRFKFPVNYPAKPEDNYSQTFIVQIWDRDIIGYNNLIGQTRIDLNKIHKIIQKAVKRRTTVKASMKIKEKNFLTTDRFWFQVFNHKQRDEFGQLQPQGKVQMSFQLMPIEKAQKEFANGYGRSEPNVYPTLAQPAGRLNFDILNPLAFLKQIIGPNLYRSLCCKIIFCLILFIIGLLAFLFLGSVLGVLAAK